MNDIQVRAFVVLMDFLRIQLSKSTELAPVRMEPPASSE